MFAEGDAHAIGVGGDRVAGEVGDLVQGLRPEELDQARDPGGESDLLVVEAVPDEFDSPRLCDQRRCCRGSVGGGDLPAGVCATVPVEEVPYVFAGAGPAGEVAVDVCLPDVGGGEAMGVVQPGEELSGFGDFLPGGESGGDHGSGGVGGAEPFEVVPAGELFDRLRDVGKLGEGVEAAGEPAFEAGEVFALAGGEHVVVGEDVAWVIDGAVAGEGVEAGVVQAEFPGADHSEQRGCAGAAHPGADALGSF